MCLYCKYRANEVQPGTYQSIWQVKPSFELKEKCTFQWSVVYLAEQMEVIPESQDQNHEYII